MRIDLVTSPTGLVTLMRIDLVTSPTGLVSSPVIAPRIGAARDAERRMLKWSEGMEPRFISWNDAAAHTFDFTFPDNWSRKKIKAPPSSRPEVSAEVWNEV